MKATSTLPLAKSANTNHGTNHDNFTYLSNTVVISMTFNEAVHNTLRFDSFIFSERVS